ncbi:hypothetical protein Fcan01_23924 [Folsomia candida]|uniref:Uncharacterized protein n=1 Tax=Folsomia candida TaxID=158441 RepID=A0A226D7R8_FOLCA|nr:hypothetical protein Fcan01_23924 [Folsomia candida]
MHTGAPPQFYQPIMRPDRVPFTTIPNGLLQPLVHWRDSQFSPRAEALQPSQAYLQYGQACAKKINTGSADDCNPIAYLACQNGFCTYYPDTIDAFYHPRTKKCIILIGSTCDPENYLGRGCVAGTCSRQTKTCTCEYCQVASYDGMSCSKALDEKSHFGRTSVHMDNFASIWTQDTENGRWTQDDGRRTLKFFNGHRTMDAGH